MKTDTKRANTHKTDTSKADTPIFDRLVSLLQWRREDSLENMTGPALTATSLRRFDMIRDRIVGQFPEAETLLYDRFEALDDDARAAITTSPEGFFVTTGATGQDWKYALDYFENAIGYAQYSTGRTDLADGQYWSALGDAYVIVRNGRADHHAAPRLSLGIPMDFDCPATRGELFGMPGGDVPVSSEIQAQVSAKVDDAIGAILHTAPAMQGFFTEFAKIVVIRTDPSHDRFISGSTKLTPGRVTLLNTQRPSTYAENIMDGFIHETIHSVVDHAELVSPMIRDRNSTSMRVASLWTGRELDVNTYLQACFVWYGLTNFFNLLAAQSETRNDACIAHREQAARGFRKGRIVQPLVDQKVALAPGLYDALDAAQDYVCNQPVN